MNKFFFTLMFCIISIPSYPQESFFYNPIEKAKLGTVKETVLKMFNSPVCNLKTKKSIEAYFSNIQGSDNHPYTIYLIFVNDQLASVEYRHEPMDEEEPIVLARKKEWVARLEKIYGKFKKNDNDDFQTVKGNTEIKISGQDCFKAAFNNIKLMEIFEKESSTFTIEDAQVQ